MWKEKKFSIEYYGKCYCARYWIDGLVIYVTSDYGSANGSLHEYDDIDIHTATPIPAVLLFRRILDEKSPQNVVNTLET